ncbi:TspO/MBR family protein [Rurimicrobium arvi]|uniref:Tryptophan-rich sensory protein n=1 Tax=Rurimicrobium arvi TaxID=2049916 RepID=A0ABP8MUF3_9BACT
MESGNNNSQSSNFIKLLISIVLCEATGAVSALIGGPEPNDWFRQLAKPSWNPPSYVFGPVWIVLYLLMAISLWRIWIQPKTPQRQKAAGLFALQLFLNFWWSVIFFRFHQAGWAFVEICFLWIAIVATIFASAPLCRKAAWLMVPYISWVSFAAILNYTIFRLNTP